MLLLDTLSTLVEFPSVSGETVATRACLDYIENSLTEAGFLTRRHASNGFESLVATSTDTKNPKVLLQAHIDVVPANSESFVLKEKEGRLSGRGVYDMKFAAACYLALASELKDELPNYDLGMMFTSDEEVGGTDGVNFLLNEGYGATVCILPDGGESWNIETDANGAWLIRLKADGLSAHGSRPWEGRCAIDLLLRGLADIRELFGKLDPTKSSLVISRIQGGTANNQVADYAEATLDMRFISEHDFRAKRAGVESIVAAHKLSVETVAEGRCTTTDLDHPEVAKFIKVAEAVRGNSIGKVHSFGSSDARYFCDKNIPTILIRPAGGGAHSENEWIDKAELLEFYEVLKTYVGQQAKIT